MTAAVVDDERLAPYFETELGALYNGDCIQIMKNMRSESIDCIFADPPFNLDKDYGTRFVDKREDYIEWCNEWIAEGSRILGNGGSFFVYCMPSIAVRLVAELNRHLEFRNWIALTMKGSYPRGNRLYPAHYALLYYTKGTPKTFKPSQDTNTHVQALRRGDKGLRGTPKDVEPVGSEPDRFLGRYLAKPSCKIQGKAGHQRIKKDHT